MTQIDRWLARAHADRAVVLTLASRAVAVLFAPLTIVMIGTRLSQDEQGFFYAFASLVALQSFVELGLSIVLVTLVSHEWAHLSLGPDGRIAGEVRALGRLISLARFALRWYAAAGALLAVALMIAGGWFLSRRAPPGLGWQSPWTAEAILAGVQLLSIPALSLLDGCRQVRQAARIRLLQALAFHGGLALALVAGAGLWAAPVALLAQILAGATAILGPHGAFFRSLTTAAPLAARIDWRTEVLPLQWRLAVQGAVNYLFFNLMTPVMFAFHGPAVAGQMGMMLQVTSALSAAGLAWLQPRIPDFGVLVARGEREGLDGVYRRIAYASSIVVAVGAVAMLAGLAALEALAPGFRSRFVELGPAALLAATAVVMNLLQCRAAYLRAHKQDPMVVLSVTSSILIGVAVWTLGQRLGPAGAAGGQLAVVLLYAAPYQAMLFRRARRGPR